MKSHQKPHQNLTRNLPSIESAFGPDAAAASEVLKRIGVAPAEVEKLPDAAHANILERSRISKKRS
jgi:hypothetical protein